MFTIKTNFHILYHQMATVELVYPKSVNGCSSIWGSFNPERDFRMTAKEGSYEDDLTDEQFQEALLYQQSIPTGRMIGVIGAMNKFMDQKTKRMRPDAINQISTIDAVCKAYGYQPDHCFRRQDFGRFRITSERATLIDGIMIQRSAVVIASDSTPDSSNAPIEAMYRLWLDEAIIALFKKDMPKPEYREWLTTLIEGRPVTNPVSIFITYDGLPDLSQGLRQVLSSPVLKLPSNHAIIAKLITQSFT